MVSLLDGLASAAFGPRAVRTDMFRSPSHGRALEAILGMADSAVPALAVIGAPGAGKTTVLRTALDELSARPCRLLRVEGASASPAELQRIIGEEPGPLVHERSPQESEAPERGAWERGEQERDDRASIVLAIDDAHLLPARTLKYLSLTSCVLAAHGASLHTVLVGRPELRTTLRCPDLAGLGWYGAAQAELLPLSREEAAEYVAHKLRLVGIPVARVMTEAALAGLIGQTAGNPGLIDEAAGRVLSAAGQRGRRHVTRGLVRQALSAPHGAEAARAEAKGGRWGRQGGWRPIWLAAAGAAGVAGVAGAITIRPPADWVRWPGRSAMPAAAGPVPRSLPASAVPGPEEPARIIPAVAAAPLSLAAEPLPPKQAEPLPPTTAGAPPPGAKPGPEQQANATVAELISQGGRQLREGHVRSPAGDNATETFERIMAVLPDASAETLIAAVAFHSRLAEAGRDAGGDSGKLSTFADAPLAVAPEAASNVAAGGSQGQVGAELDLSRRPALASDSAPAPDLAPAAFPVAAPPGGNGTAEVTPLPAGEPPASPATADRAGLPAAAPDQAEPAEGTAVPAVPVRAAGEAGIAPPRPAPRSVRMASSEEQRMAAGGNDAAPPPGQQPSPASATSSGGAGTAAPSSEPPVAPAPSTAERPAAPGPDAAPTVPGPPPAVAGTATIPQHAPAAVSADASAVPAIPAPAQPAPAQPAMPAALVEALLRRGDAMLAIGDISAARLLFRSAAASGSERAARAMGKSYDPLFLREIGARGIQPDPAAAASWYRKAIERGDREAADRLSRLDAK